MCATTGWPLERALFAMAGTVTLLSAALAAVVSPWFLLLTAFVGVNQWLANRFLAQGRRTRARTITLRLVSGLRTGASLPGNRVPKRVPNSAILSRSERT